MTTEERANRISIPTWLVYLLAFLASIGISAFVAYGAAQSSMNARVSVLESQFQDVRRRLESIETKLDRLLIEKERRDSER